MDLNRQFGTTKQLAEQMFFRNDRFEESKDVHMSDQESYF